MLADASNRMANGVSGSDVNCRALLEDIVKHGCLQNYSRINKDDIVLYLNKVMVSLAKHPSSLWQVLGDIAPPRTVAEIPIGRGYDGDYTNSPGGGPEECASLAEAAVQATEEDASSAAGVAAENLDSPSEEAPEARRPICRWSWAGRACKEEKPCPKRHPTFCTSKRCVPKWEASCKFFHPKIDKYKVKKSNSGNAQKGNRGPSSNSRTKTKATSTADHEKKILKLKAQLAEARRGIGGKYLSYRDATLNSQAGGPYVHVPMSSPRALYSAVQNPAQHFNSEKQANADLATLVAQAVVAALAGRPRA